MNNKQKIIEVFKRNELKGSYSLFDSEHPLRIFLGSNENGEKSLLVVADSKKGDALSSKFIKVRFGRRPDDSVILSFDLMDERYEEIFYNFCEDIIKSTYTAKPEDGFLPIISRYEIWQNFFKRENSFLSENEIMGLIGELLFIKERLMPKYGTEDIIRSYLGIDKAHKDFDFEDAWYEIKTIHNGVGQIKISSLEQLDSDRDGFLEVVTLDESAGGERAITLNRLVDDVLMGLDSLSASRLGEKLLQLGYCRDDYYDSYGYYFISASEYRVSEGFPRLTKSGMPNGVVSAKYEISLSAIEGYRGIEWMQMN